LNSFNISIQNTLQSRGVITHDLLLNMQYLTVFGNTINCMHRHSSEERCLSSTISSNKAIVPSKSKCYSGFLNKITTTNSDTEVLHMYIPNSWPTIIIVNYKNRRHSSPKCFHLCDMHLILCLSLPLILSFFPFNLGFIT